jgi:hypothetical protein
MEPVEKGVAVFAAPVEYMKTYASPPAVRARDVPDVMLAPLIVGGLLDPAIGANATSIIASASPTDAAATNAFLEVIGIFIRPLF